MEGTGGGSVADVAATGTSPKLPLRTHRYGCYIRESAPAPRAHGPGTSVALARPGVFRADLRASTGGIQAPRQINCGRWPQSSGGAKTNRVASMFLQ